MIFAARRAQGKSMRRKRLGGRRAVFAGGASIASCRVMHELGLVLDRMSSPLCITPMRRPSPRIRRCRGVRMMVTPSGRSARTMSQLSVRSSTSKPAVGSSRKRILRLARERPWRSAAALHDRRTVSDFICLLVPQRRSLSTIWSHRRSLRGCRKHPAERTVPKPSSNASVVSSCGRGRSRSGS